MTVETVAYALVALALVVAGGTLLYLAVRRGPAEGDGRPVTPLGGNPEKQVAVSVLLVAVIFILTLAYVVREPSRMARAAQRQQEMAIEKGAHTYTSLCVSCHGPHGEGGLGKPLNTAPFREGSAQELDKTADMLRKTISRGRFGTAMPAWAQDDGGPLNPEQISQLVTLIQYGDWAEVAELASETPLQPAPAPGTTGASAPDAAHPGASDLAGQGKQLFVAKGCAACHGAVLQGGAGPNLQHFASKADIVGVAPLNTENLTKWLSDPAGVKPGTAMPKLGLGDRDLEALVAFLMQQK